MDELVRWLGEQLDEDERIVRAVHGPIDGPLGRKWWTPEEVKTRLCDDQIHMSDAEHIAVWGPARVLREIEAKRQIIEQHKRYAAERRRMMGGWDPQSDDSPILVALATAYADRPGYREEWRP